MFSGYQISSWCGKHCCVLLIDYLSGHLAGFHNSSNDSRINEPLGFISLRISIEMIMWSPVCSIAQSCPTLWDSMDCSTPGLLSITNSQSLLKLMSIELVMPSKHLILCPPLLLLLSSISPNITVFSNESVRRMRWPKYWSFNFSISPSNEYAGLISFRMDWLDLFEVQGTLKSLLQNHSSKASILQCLAFFIVQLSHPYVITGKTIN